MEYIVVVLLLALIAVLLFKKPNKIQSVITNTAIEALRKNEAEIVQGLYNKLPKSIKEKVDSKTIAEIVSFTIGIVADLFDKKELAE